MIWPPEVVTALHAWPALLEQRLEFGGVEWVADLHAGYLFWRCRGSLPGLGVRNRFQIGARFLRAVFLALLLVRVVDGPDTAVVFSEPGQGLARGAVVQSGLALHEGVSERKAQLLGCEASHRVILTRPTRRPTSFVLPSLR